MRSVAEPATGASAESIRAWQRHLGRELDPVALRAELTEGTLTEVFHRTAADQPDRMALQVGDAQITHGELDARAARLGGWIRSQGVRPGDRVLVTGRSSAELVLAYLGVLRAGAAMVPADPWSTVGELAHLIADSGAVAAWADAEAHGHLIQHGELRFALDGTGLREASEVGESLAPARGAPDDLAMVAYTSGTTGAPKGVALSHGNLLASLRAVMQAWRWSADDVLVHGLPLSHQHGLSGVQIGLLAGSRAVLLERFEPERLCDVVRSAGATVVFAVPAMYERLLAWDGFEGADLQSVRLWVSGSAPLAPGVAARLAERLGELPLERYGSTETGLSVSNLYDGPRKAGSVGLPLPGLEVAIADGGEILLRGPQVFASYWEQPDTTAEAFSGDGWFRTGDLGRLEPGDGDLVITGRIKDMILTGGLNVSPREVELALEEHPTVARAAVIGVPSERWGEQVVAFVVPDASGAVEEDALIRHVRERLSAHKCPKQVFAVDALPVGETGKVRRAELVELAEKRNREAS